MTSLSRQTQQNMQALVDNGANVEGAGAVQRSANAVRAFGTH